MKEGEGQSLKNENKESIQSSDNDVLFISLFSNSYAIGEFEDGIPFEQKLTGSVSAIRNGKTEMVPQYAPSDGRLYKNSMGQVKWKMGQVDLEKGTIWIFSMNEAIQAILHPRFVYINTAPNDTARER